MKSILFPNAKKLVALLVWTVFFLPMSFAAYLTNVPQTLVQPNGDTLHCFATGDEYYHRLHDANGYTIVLNPANGYYVYADKVNGEIVPTRYVAGRVNPAEVGLTPNISISASQWRERRQQWEDPNPPRTHTRSGDRNHGHINNLVVFIRFADDDPFENDFNEVGNMFNDSTPGHSSMYNYFKAASYNQLAITASFYPAPSGSTILSYQDIYNRGYYQPYSSENTEGYSDNERTSREFLLLKRAVEYIADMVPADLNIDYDNDGLVDNIVFVVRGNVGEWNDLLWPHQWSIYNQYVYINGKRVYKFNFQLADAISYFNTSVLCHEMNHSLGAPDLYHYSDDFRGLVSVYTWDLMHQNTNPPQHMGAWMKYRYGNWIESIPQITECGTYSLHSLGSSATNNCYFIASPNDNEFFVLEYRNKSDLFEGTLPGSGLLVYRINTDFNGNADYDGENYFDEVYIYRPFGTPTENGNITQAAFSENTGRTEMNENTSAYPFLTDGTVVPIGNFALRNISEAGGDSITFTFCASESAFSKPTVTLDDISNVGTTTATCSGTVTADGGAEVTARGFCWSSTDSYPTVSGSHSTEGSGTGSFTGDITGLDPNTSYAVRAYATNSEGTSYSDTWSITTYCNPVSVSISGTTAVCAGEYATLTASGTHSYEWNTDDTAASITVDPTLLAYDKNYILQENFDNGYLPAGWSTEDGDGDGYDWYVGSIYSYPAHSGTSSLISASYISGVGALSPDNWLYTPAITIPADVDHPTLSWWARGTYSPYEKEHYAVSISTDSQNWLTAYEGESTDAYVQHTVDLSDYAGRTIYVAFQHYAVTDMYYLFIDDIEVYHLTPTNTVTYTVIGSDEYGCTATASHTVTIRETPDVTISGDSILCEVSSTTLTASGANSYLWSTDEETASISVTPTSTTTYTVIGTSQDGCTDTASITVTISSSTPLVTTGNVSDITTTSATCGGEVVCSGAGDVTARGVCWSTSPNPTVADSLTIDGTGTGIFTSSLTGLSQNTTYYVRAYATNSEGTGYGDEMTFTTPCDNIHVTISGNTEICEGESTTLIASGANTYLWSTGETTDTIIINSQSTITQSVFILQESFDDGVLPNGWLSIDADGDSYSWDAEYPIQANFITHSGTGCIGSASYINDIGELTPDNWLISPELNIPANASHANLSWWAVAADVNWPNDFYAVYVSTTGNSVANFTEAPIYTGVSTSEYTQHTVDLSIYAGQSIHIAFRHYDVTDIYWIVLDDIEVSYIPEISNNYTVTGTDQHGCSATTNTMLTIHAKPAITISGGETTICGGETITLTASGADSYAWSNGDETASTTVTPDASTTYSVIGTNVHECTATASVTVSVHELPVVTTINVDNISSTSVTCEGNVACGGTSTVTARGFCYNTWGSPSLDDNHTTDGTGTGYFTGNLSGLTPNNTYYVRAYATNATGTTYGETQWFHTTCAPIPLIIDGNTDVCEDESITLTASGASTYEWNTGESTAEITVQPSLLAYEKNFLMQEYFDNGILPNGWDISDDDGDGYNWQIRTDNGYSHNNSAGFIASASWINGYGALQPDNSLFSNNITIPANVLHPTLSWWVRGVENPYASEHYAVYISTDYQNWQNVYEGESTAEFVQHTVDLSEYAGQTINIRFRHYNTYDMEWLILDDVEVYHLTPANSATYTVTGTDAYGCTATASIDVTIHKPVVTISGGETIICGGETVTLTASGTDSYLWSNNGEETGSITVTPTATTTYMVTGTDQYGCTATDSITVTLSELPIVHTYNASNITTHTATGNGMITCSGTSAVTARGVCWSASPNPTIADSYTTDGSGTGSFTSSLTGLNSGFTYYVRAYATNSEGTAYGEEVTFRTPADGRIVDYGLIGFYDGTSLITEITLDINDDLNPTVVIVNNGPDLPAAYDTIFLDITINGIPFGSQWLLGSQMATQNVGSALLWQSNSPLLTASYMDALGIEGTFEFCYNVRSYGAATDPVASNNTACLTVNRGSFSSRPIVDYALLGFSDGTSTIDEELLLDMDDDLNLYVIIQNNGPDVPASTDTVFFDLELDGYPIGSAHALGNILSTYTEGQTFNLGLAPFFTASDMDAGGLVGTFEICWTVRIEGDAIDPVASNNTACVIINRVAPTQLPSVITNSVTDITTTSATCGGEVTDDGGATVTARGVCWSTTPNPTVADSVTLDGTGTGTFTSSLTNLTPNTTYYVRAYATNSEGTAYGEEMTFTTPCDIVNLTLSGNDTLCAGESSVLTAAGAENYLWSTDDTIASITVTPVATTTYTVTGTNLYGCSATDSITVTVHTLPVVSISGDTTLCAGESSVLTAAGAETYLWNTDDTIASITVTPAATTTYTVTGTNQYGCTATASITVTVHELPVITISGDTTITEGSSTTLSVTDNPQWDYLWSTGDATASITVSPAETTSYSVTVTDGPCVSEASITVTVVTGVNEWNTTNLHIYPNPTAGIVNISLSSETCNLNPEIQMFDIYGRRLQMMPVTDEMTQIDLSRYPTGVYMLKVVKDGKVTAIGKVVKE